MLDIGCGAGLTSREAARAAMKGEVVGVDTSAELLEVARSRCADEGLRNVTFEQADANPTHMLPPISIYASAASARCFFADPAAAFANIARAMRPGARLVWMVWQNQERNEWSAAIRQVLNPESTPSEDIPMAFSLGDPAVATDLLSAAGFMSIGFIEVHEPVFYGQSVDAAFDALTSFQMVKDVLDRTNASAAKASQRLRDLLDAHLTTKGGAVRLARGLSALTVRFDSWRGRGARTST